MIKTKRYGMRFIAIFFLSATMSASAIPVVSIKEAMKNNANIKYIKVNDKSHLKLKRFPIASSSHSSWETPIIPETFIVSIPNGRVHSKNGVIIINNNLLQELIWPWSKLKKHPESFKTEELPPVKYIPGKLAVLAQESSYNYYHWMTEVLPKLALLEKSNIKYDWIYIPKQTSNFMKETLTLFKIDSRKIISAEQNTFLEAEELIVPSFVSRSCYTPDWVASYLRKKLIPPTINDSNIDFSNMPKKIFISRNRAPYRKIINEDEIRTNLLKKGFVSLNLGDLSVKKQIALFQNARIIIAPHGAGLTNLLFAKPNTMVLEIFQAHEDDAYWYLSQTLKLNHYCIKITKFLKKGGYLDTKISWEILNKEIETILTSTTNKDIKP